MMEKRQNQTSESQRKNSYLVTYMAFKGCIKGTCLVFDSLPPPPYSFFEIDQLLRSESNVPTTIRPSSSLRSHWFLLFCFPFLFSLLFL
ncbi:hypothetical protein OG21DRAFT_1138346 [Imleria badia]|nr:hypothetical protein OG21DRAFT_1138346 [Imleria badia]